MKLNPDDLSVTSFQTSDSDALAGPGTSYDPTAMTFCYYCPPRSMDCPGGTVDTIVIVTA